MIIEHRSKLISKSPLLFLLSFFLLLTYGCFNEKKITYFEFSKGRGDSIPVAKPYIAHIQSGDILSIYVNSLSTDATVFFNPYAAASVVTPASTGGSPATQSPSGYLVDSAGTIEMPLLGKVKVAGLTTMVARDTIRNKLQIFLKDPTVDVRFLNYRISILGEVKNPGVYVIPSETVTLPEALTLAGDVTIYAKINDIVIIREVNGKKTFMSMDMTSKDIFSSPYYYLHNDDIIQVKATKAKVTQTDLLFKAVPFYVALITAIILIYTRFK